MSTLAEANRKYFDHISGAYDDKPWFTTINNMITDHLRGNLDWVGIPFANTVSSSKDANVRLLDYACGTGLFSRIYGPYVTVTRGIDVSPNMVATYNARARAASLSTSAINAVHGDLLDKVNPSPPEFSGPEWSDFDFTTVGFAFHHFEDVVHAAKALKERLRPGGVLLLTDFLEGGDLKADEHGDPISGSEGNWAIHSHGHGHGHGHGHDHGHGHGKERDHAHHHQHHHHDHSDKKQEHEDPALKHLEEMKASMIKPHFTIDFVRSFLTEAGFVDVEVVTMKDRAYMEFAGLKLWRTILMAKGRKPDVAGERSEL